MAVPHIRALDPASKRENSEARAFSRALAIFREAARRVPAYRDFLKKAGVKAEKIRTKADFRHVPETDKPSYFSQYSLRDLSWDGALKDAKYVSTSSGSTGIPFFWPRGEEQDQVTGLIAEQIFTKLLGAGKGSTLFVNSFSLGTWIAGLEFFNAARWTIERGTPITIVTPGIDKLEAVHQIRTLAPLFDRIIIAGYPPFVKDIIDHGKGEGIAWPSIDLRLFFGGEAVSEVWKERLLERIGRPGETARVVNLYGMAETGMVAHETPASVLLRRHLAAPARPGFPDPAQVTGVYQYYPLARYFEAVENDSLLLTANAGLPLIRYSTRDTGVLIEHEQLASLPAAFRQDAKRAKTDLGAWRMPFVCLYGRKDLSISLYAVNIYVENVKRALERSKFESQLSGLFTMAVGHASNLDQRFEITIELSARAKPRATLAEALAKEIIATMRTVNSEYAKLYSVVGEKAAPRVTLASYGAIDTVPGRKHRWIKRAAPASKKASSRA